MSTNKELLGHAKLDTQTYSSLMDKQRATKKESTIGQKINSNPTETNNSYNYVGSNDMKIPISDKQLVTSTQYKNFKIIPNVTMGRITDGESPRY